MRNPLSIEAFADWCAKKPADHEYDYVKSEVCACGQYAAHLGIDRWDWCMSRYTKMGGFWKMADDVAATGPYTFGALAQRLRSAS